MVKLLPSRIVEVVCDDVIEDELPQKKAENNDFLLYEFKDGNDEMNQLQEVQRATLYRLADTEPLPEDMLKTTLGRKRHPADDLERAVCLERIRDYVMAKQDPPEQQPTDKLLL